MAKRQVYIATVQIVVVAEDTFKADDILDSLLSEYDEANGRLADWYYLKIGSHRLSPTLHMDAEKHYGDTA